MITNSDLKGAALSAANADRGRDCLLTPAIDVVQQIPGRLRFRAAGLKGDAGASVQAKDRLAQIAGVKAVKANASTGSLLVEYDPAAVSPGRIIDALSAPAEVPPVADSGESGPGWAGQLTSYVSQWVTKAIAEQVALALFTALI
jgi:copper chaperone CopZ